MNTNSPKINIRGQKFGYLSVGEYLGNNRWKCICTGCFTPVLKTTSELTSGKSLMCDACKLKKVLAEIDKQ